MSFKATFSGSPTFVAEFSENTPFEAEFSDYIEVPIVDYYDGDYEATPTNRAQTIPVIGKTMMHDFVVKPIPNNYGLITWDGSTLTVS